MGHNWWTACVGSGAILALALRAELPTETLARQAVDALPEWFGFAGDAIQHKPRTFDRAGGMYESIGATPRSVSRRPCCSARRGSGTHPKAALEPIPQIGLLADFFCHVSYPRTGELFSINFGYSHKTVTGESSLLLACAQGAARADVKWYVSQIRMGQHREGYPLNTPMGLLYTPDLKGAPDESAPAPRQALARLRLGHHAHSLETDATMLAVKSGMTWNHSHADAGLLHTLPQGCRHNKGRRPAALTPSPTTAGLLFPVAGPQCGARRRRGTARLSAVSRHHAARTARTDARPRRRQVRARRRHRPHEPPPRPLASAAFCGWTTCCS